MKENVVSGRLNRSKLIGTQSSEGQSEMGNQAMHPGSTLRSDKPSSTVADSLSFRGAGERLRVNARRRSAIR